MAGQNENYIEHGEFEMDRITANDDRKQAVPETEKQGRTGGPVALEEPKRTGGPVALKEQESARRLVEQEEWERAKRQAEWTKKYNEEILKKKERNELQRRLNLANDNLDKVMKSYQSQVNDVTGKYEKALNRVIFFDMEEAPYTLSTVSFWFYYIAFIILCIITFIVEGFSIREFLISIVSLFIAPVFGIYGVVDVFFTPGESDWGEIALAWIFVVALFILLQIPLCCLHNWLQRLRENRISKKYRKSMDSIEKESVEEIVQLRTEIDALKKRIGILK